MNLIERYFPDLSAQQKSQFEALGTLYNEWNEKINVISRKDIENLYEHHVLHSLGIDVFLHFKPGSSVMDVGTGGGFPAVPLAILLPDVRFHLLDSIGKKLTVARAVAEAIGLTNVTFRHGRVEEEKATFDFVISRAVMSLPDLYNICRKNIAAGQQNALPNGIICLKGGELQEEIRPFKHLVSIMELSKCFEEAFFKTKKVVYLPVKQVKQ